MAPNAHPGDFGDRMLGLFVLGPGHYQSFYFTCCTPCAVLVTKIFLYSSIIFRPTSICFFVSASNEDFAWCI